MDETSKIPTSKKEPNLAEEMAQIPYEPLLPIEIKLIVGSLLLGLGLLGILLWISNSFFSPPPIP